MAREIIINEDRMLILEENEDILVEKIPVREMYSADFIFQKMGRGKPKVIKDKSGKLM